MMLLQRLCLTTLLITVWTNLPDLQAKTQS
jgi:hypothetical protein